MGEGAYAAAGVDIDAQERAIELFRDAVRATYTPAVATDVGSFGGMVAFDPQGRRRPMLVSSIDSVGTKVKVAALLGVFDTIGIDIVHHCVNDIAVMGAEPLFFVDYYAAEHFSPEEIAQVVGGVAKACQGVGCPLLGGELAELPGVYRRGEFDLVGCVVGLVDRDEVPRAETVRDGDALVGLLSTGLHTNGYSLARRVLLTDDVDPTAFDPELGSSLGEALLAPHRCYLDAIRALRRARLLKVVAHITGGGVRDNLPRVLPAGLGAEIVRGTWQEPPIFGRIARQGRVATAELFRALNMGLGLVAVVAAEAAEAAIEMVQRCGFAGATVGSVRAGLSGVRIVE